MIAALPYAVTKTKHKEICMKNNAPQLTFFVWQKLMTPTYD